jgi:hypothetical protein
MKVPGAAIMVCALAIAIVPQLTDCQSHGMAMTLANGRRAPMKCHWTAMSEIATGGSLLVLGAAMALSRRKESRRGLAAMGATLGAFTMLLPTVLIGVCSAGSMGSESICNLIMRPALLLLGTIVIVTSLASLVMSERSVE